MCDCSAMAEPTSPSGLTSGNSFKETRMADFLEDLFTPAVIQQLKRRQAPSAALTRRLDVLTAVEDPGAELRERTWQRILLAQRAAWLNYVTAMRDAGLMDADVIARLTGTSDDQFRSALAECLTCHFLGSVRGLAVTADRPKGRTGRVLDFGVTCDGGNLNLEVKSPFVEKPQGSFWGNHSRILGPALELANQQFEEGHRNVLALVPLVEFPVLNGRQPFVKALFGEHKMVITIDTKLGRAIGEPEVKFFAQGKFLNHPRVWPKPLFTRTGAVLALRERRVEENLFDETFSARVELYWMVLHNPNCPTPIPQELWGQCPQLIEDGDNMRWTDGEPVET